MVEASRWMLPAGVREILPPEAWRLESLRRRLLDHFRACGYELVEPPLVDHLESLLTGTGRDLELRTCKLVDQVSGRLLGVRADMTPQVARIDAHHFATQAPVRLCYLGPVLQTLPDAFGGGRGQLQVGAELYGHAGVEADAEVVSLMLDTLAVAGLAPVHVDLGHVGLFRALALAAGLASEPEAVLFDAMQRKATVEVEACVDASGASAPVARALKALVRLHGEVATTLAEAQAVLADCGPSLGAALAELETLAARVSARAPAGTRVCVDLAELSGYSYQTGAVFAAFVPGRGQEIARGGRYDNIARGGGPARPATGFSADLLALLSCAHEPAAPAGSRIWVSVADAGPAAGTIAALRAGGDVVVVELPGTTPAQAQCTHRLCRQGDRWDVVRS